MNANACPLYVGTVAQGQEWHDTLTYKNQGGKGRCEHCGQPLYSHFTPPATEAVAKPVPPDGYRLFEEADYEIYGPMDLLYSFEGSQWRPSTYRGTNVPKGTGKYYATKQPAQPTPSGPTARDSMDVHLKTALEEIARLKEELRLKSMRIDSLNNLNSGVEDENDQLRAALTAAETKAGAMEEWRAEAEETLVRTGRELADTIARAESAEAALKAAKVCATYIARILKQKRDSDDSTIHAGNTSFKSLEQWAANILALPPAPSVASEKEGICRRCNSRMDLVCDPIGEREFYRCFVCDPPELPTA